MTLTTEAVSTRSSGLLLTQSQGPARRLSGARDGYPSSETACQSHGNGGRPQPTDTDSFDATPASR
jgi:hypothetical protein